MPIFLLFLVLLIACSDKYASLVNSAPVPRLRFDRDTIVLREKDYSFIASVLNPFLKLYAVPSPAQMNIQFTDSSGRLRFIYRGVQMEDGKPIVVAGDSTMLFCACDTTGLYAVDFYLTDHLGKTDSKQLIIQCLENERPKAAFSVSLLDSSIVSNWQYRFDGSGSLKRHGLITAYNFTIDGAPITSASHVVDYTFHQKGEHEIKLYVIDDLGFHSDTISQKISIP